MAAEVKVEALEAFEVTTEAEVLKKFNPLEPTTDHICHYLAFGHF